ncbi:ABC transporter permease [Pseudonocardia sp. ICBG1142]|uniref:ABC transporter permease n=1 Tax=Pseudonocardia sp. ICBG1142 TaxID=2846760 RepID=UPI001CF65581|nr:ABC transporter permease [Pseudonocardia sp. ICBG1142]
MPRLLGFVLRQVGLALLTVLVSAVLVFSALHLVPGNYVDVLLGPQATPAERAAAVSEYGLDRSIVVQFATWMGNLLRGDLGTSLRSGEPVLTEILDRAPITLELAALGCLFTVLPGIALGVCGGIAARRRTAAATRLGNALLLSLPEILVGGVLVVLITTYVVPFTVGVWPDPFTDPAGNLAAAVPPAIVISLFGAGFLMATTRRAVATVLREPYVRADEIRGVGARTVYRRHLWRNISAPVVTVVGVYLASVLTGAAIAEQMFALNGIGSYLVSAADQRDYPVVQGMVLVVTVVFVLINMIIDILYGVIDPRIGRRGTA